jgi:hypothetical protein
MRIVCLAAAVLLSACGDERAPQIIVPAATEIVESPPPVVERPTVDGWSLSEDEYSILGTVTPGFAGNRHKGGRVTQDALRGKWTILGFWGLWSDDSIADARYMSALVSAAKQDPDLEFMSVHIPPGPDRGDEALGAFLSLDQFFADQGGSWPTIVDTEGRIAAQLQIDSAPLYLLIGPDLTIEAWRGPLAATPEDGIKPVIRGVAEIRKQIASPE